METCEVCGFAWETVTVDEVGPRIVAGSNAIAELLAAAGIEVSTRPNDGRWSALEYGAHVRDVLLHVRDRMVIGLVEQDPTFKPLYREERVDLGLYSLDTIDLVTTELLVAAGLFTRTFSTIGADELAREVEYTYPTPATRTVLWMGQQVVHEVEHHRDDVEAGLALLAR